MSVSLCVRRACVWSALAGALFLAPIWAQEGPREGWEFSMRGLVEVLAFLTAILGMVWLVIQIVKSSRATPALHEQFSAKAHIHPEYVTRQELAEVLRSSASSDQVIIAKIESLDKKVSDGFSRVHGRIDPMAEALAATAKLLDHHLNDHRTKGI